MGKDFIVGTADEFYHYSDKIIDFIENDEELKKLNPRELTLVLAAVLYGLGYTEGLEDGKKGDVHEEGT